MVVRGLLCVRGLVCVWCLVLGWCLWVVDGSGTRLGLVVWGCVCSSVMGFMWVGVVGEGGGCLMLCGI